MSELNTQCSGIEVLGFEWCKPRNFWASRPDGLTPIPYSGTVNIKTNEGYLLLCRVERFIAIDGCSSSIRRIPVSLNEVNFADR